MSLFNHISARLLCRTWIYCEKLTGNQRCLRFRFTPSAQSRKLRVAGERRRGEIGAIKGGEMV